MALVTLATLKERLRYDPSEDAFLTNCITRAEALCDRAAGRPLEDSGSDVTEYYDGDGTRDLNLVRGPVVSVTSVSTVTRDADGNESLSALTANADFAIYGLQSEAWLLPSFLRHTSYWTKSTTFRNYKVIYRAGWQTANMPADLEDAILYAVVWLFQNRSDAATGARSVGDGSVEFKDDGELVNDLRRRLASFIAG